MIITSEPFNLIRISSFRPKKRVNLDYIFQDPGGSVLFALVLYGAFHLVSTMNLEEPQKAKEYDIFCLLHNIFTILLIQTILSVAFIRLRGQKKKTL